jgi:hypothetical protein
MDRIQAHSMTTIEDMKKLKVFNEFYEPHSYFYQLPNDKKLSEEELIQFLEDTKYF